MKKSACSLLMLLCLIGLPRAAAAQAAKPDPAPAAGSGNHPAVGVALKLSTLGVGLDAAVRVHRKVNLRGAFNFLSYSHDFENKDDNITYGGDLKLRSATAFVDYFPFGGGFHISPMFLLNNGNKVSLFSTIAGGKTFDVDDVSYMSSPTNPVKASGSVTFKGGRPGILIGWGNIAGRRRVTVPFEMGVIFAGQPAGTLSFTGTICQTNGQLCRDAGSDATFQSRVRAEETDLNDTIKPFRFYPVLSLGLSFRF